MNTKMETVLPNISAVNMKALVPSAPALNARLEWILKEIDSAAQAGATTVTCGIPDKGANKIATELRRRGFTLDADDVNVNISWK